MGETSPHWGVPERWREKLLEIAKSNNLRWLTSKEVFFQWPQNLLFFGVPAEPRRLGEASSSLTSLEVSIEGLLALMPYQLEEQAHRGKPLKKKRHLIKGITPFPSPLSLGLVISREEDERLEALHFGVVALSSERRQADNEESVILAKGAGVPSVGVNPMGIPMEEVVKGDTSSPESEAREPKILSDLLPVQSRGLRESNALNQAMPLDREGCGPAERILLEFLPDVWRELRDLEYRFHLIDGCASQAKYHYHVMKELPSTTLGHPEEYLEGSVMTAISKTHRTVEEQSDGKGRATLLLSNPQDGEEGPASKGSVGAGGGDYSGAKKAAAKLLVDLDAAKLERDEMIDDAKATLLAKRDLEYILAKTTMEVTNLLLLQLEAKTSLYRLSEQGLSTELKATKAEVALLLEQVINPTAREAESLAEFEALKAEVALLHEQVIGPTAREAKSLAELKASKDEVVLLCEKAESLAKFKALKAKVALLREQVAGLEVREAELLTDLEAS
ncbi:hypothetical protein ACLOJK_040821 [Asimina triloba]